MVQWDKVYLQGKEDMGSFTFQAALHSSGRIVFGYQEVRGVSAGEGTAGGSLRGIPVGLGAGGGFAVTTVHTLGLGIPSAAKALETWGRAGLHHALSSRPQIPVPVLQISASQHPVKAGLSDAFMILNPSPDVPGESCTCGVGGGGCWGRGAVDPSLGDAKAPLASRLGAGAVAGGEMRCPHLWVLDPTRMRCLDSRWGATERAEMCGARPHGCPSCPTSPGASLAVAQTIVQLWVAPWVGGGPRPRTLCALAMRCLPSVFGIAVSSQAIASPISS